MSRYNDQLEDELDMALDRAKAAEAQLDEMTRSCLAEREGRIATESRLSEATRQAVEALEPFARIADMEERAEPAASVFVNVARCRDARTTLDRLNAMKGESDG